MRRVLASAITIIMLIPSGLASEEGTLDASSNSLFVGVAAYGDWKSDFPGKRRYIRASDLPAPYATPSTMNGAVLVEKPGNARLNVPLGFQVKQFASSNRAKHTGYKIIRGVVTDGVPSGEYEDFVTGFVIDDARIWGRPVGVAQAKDGSLLFSEDGNGTIWRVSYAADEAGRLLSPLGGK
jgi:hypothetical protein